MATEGANQIPFLESHIVFLERAEKYQLEKPYKLQYDPGADSEIPRTNTVSKYYGPIRVHDFRALEKPLTFAENGFCALTIESKLAPEDFYDDEKVRRTYYPELQALVRETFKATRVEILEHLIRRRHAEFPVSTGEDYDHLQPTAVAHVDFTLDSALQSSNDILKVDNAEYSRIQCVNIWKPLRGPVSDWPLGLCDEATADANQDYIASDVVSRTGFTENYLIYHNPKQVWYYLSDQEASEAIVFRQGDTEFPELKGVPHTGFQNHQSNVGEVPRESVEVRAFIYY